MLKSSINNQINGMPRTMMLALVLGTVGALQVGGPTTTKKGTPKTIQNFQNPWTLPAKETTTLKKTTPTQLEATFFGASKKNEVVVPRDFTLTIVIAAIAAYLDTIPYVQYAFGAPLTFVAAFFFVQTIRIRFVFEDKEFGIKASQAWTAKDELTATGENYVVGGKNRWKYNTVVNYDAFPKWLPFAVLLYFKETQTPKDVWVSNPVGRLSNNPKKIQAGAKPGQVHFFPAVCNAKIFKEEFKKRGCPKIN